MAGVRRRIIRARPRAWPRPISMRRIIPSPSHKKDSQEVARAGAGQGLFSRWRFSTSASLTVRGVPGGGIALISPLHPIGRGTVLRTYGAARNSDARRRAAAGALAPSRPDASWNAVRLAARAGPRSESRSGTEDVAWSHGSIYAWWIHAAALWIWHIPQLFQATLDSEWMHPAQHASFFISALLFWWALFYGHGEPARAAASSMCLQPPCKHPRSSANLEPAALVSGLRGHNQRLAIDAARRSGAWRSDYVGAGQYDLSWGRAGSACGLVASKRKLTRGSEAN
jgi:hypothetical protein